MSQNADPAVPVLLLLVCGNKKNSSPSALTEVSLPDLGKVEINLSEFLIFLQFDHF